MLKGNTYCTVVLHQTNLDFFKKGQLQLGGQISRPIFRADSESAARFGLSWPALIEILRPKISSLAWPRSVVCTTSARVDAMRELLARNHGMACIRMSQCTQLYYTVKRTMTVPIIFKLELYSHRN